MTELRMAWVARARCGHIVAAHADNGPGGDASRSWVAVGAPTGATFERLTSEQVRTEGFCPGHPAAMSAAADKLGEAMG